MANCELIEKCIVFNDRMQDMPVMSGIMKDRYAEGIIVNAKDT